LDANGRWRVATAARMRTLGRLAAHRCSSARARRPAHAAWQRDFGQWSPKSAKAKWP